MSGLVCAATGTPAVTQSVTATPMSGRAASLCLKAAEDWAEEDLAYYIGEEMERIHGPQLPCRGTDQIVHDFWERFGPDAVRIARFTFEALGGMWMGAPVTMRRFSQGHDGFFSDRVLTELGKG
jgi:hypothetical protein